MSAVTLRVNGLSAVLSGREVLADVDLSVAAGELVALLGPNGAGKTTLLRSILGLVRPSSGEISIDPLGGSAAAMGYVPQRHDFAWDFPISVGDVVMTGLTGRIGPFRRPAARDWRAVARALERVRMVQLADRPVGELSGGQRQRVLVARALALEPALLLLDEPFTGLDIPTQDLLSELFASLAAEGRAVLMTTHDLLSALDGADRVVLLNRTVIAAGAPRELAADPGPWMRAFGVGERSSLLRVLGSVAG